MNPSTSQLLSKLISRSRNRGALSRAITLIESIKPSDMEQASLLLDELTSKANISKGEGMKSNWCIGVAGSPGAGKSTFIEALGLHILEAKPESTVSVLCIDPSSKLSGGSILGDKTRMTELSRNDRAFVRPSPTSGALGGLTCTTSESILACEASGLGDITFVESVGVGQNEVDIDMACDMVILLLSPGGGDSLQGVKKGIVEVADFFVVNKADGDLKASARHTAGDYGSALCYVRRKSRDWTPPVLLASSTTGEGIAEVWRAIQLFCENMSTNGEMERKRIKQRQFWVEKHVEDLVKQHMRSNNFRRSLSSSKVSSRAVARQLFNSIVNRQC